MNGNLKVNEIIDKFNLSSVEDKLKQNDGKKCVNCKIHVKKQSRMCSPKFRGNKII